MSHNALLSPKPHAYKNLLGQIPCTLFKDNRKAIKVTLKSPEPESQIMDRIYAFVKSTWADTPEQLEGATEAEKREALDQMLSGKALGLGLETIGLTFMIAGINHIDAQQITRQRVGVTFSAQCTGDRFLNHNDVLVEECVAQDPYLLRKFIQSTLACKKTYCEMVDSQKVSIQAARAILPRNIETFYNMHTNLSTLLFFHQKRIEVDSQTWQMNEIAQQMANEVCKYYPQLKDVFERNKNKFKLQHDQSKDRKNMLSSSLYIPNKDEFEYHTRDFLYPMKKIDMHYTNTPIENTYYWGSERVTKEQYDEIKDAYCKHDKEVSIAELDNETIRRKAAGLSLELSTNLRVKLS